MRNNSAHEQRSSAHSLPLVDSPLPYENVQGFILRLSERNLYERPRWIYSLVAKEFSDFSFANLRKIVDQLAHLTGTAQKELSEIAYGCEDAPNYNSVSVGGRFNLPPTLMHIENPKVCPGCVREYGAVAAVWDLRPYIACSKHRCYLVDKCSVPSCGRKMSWWRPYLGRCGKCEKPFEPIDQNGKPSKALLRLSRMIEGRWKPSFDPVSDGSEAIQNLNNDDFFQLLHALTSRLRNGPVANTGALSSEEIKITEIVANSLVDWPNSFDTYVSALMKLDLQSGLGFSLLNTSRFGSFFHTVMDSEAKTHLRFLRGALLRCISTSDFSHQVTAKGGSRLAKAGVARGKYFTRTEVMTELRISARKFRKLFEQGVLQGSLVQMGKQHVYRVDRGSVERYKREFQ